MVINIPAINRLSHILLQIIFSHRIFLVVFTLLLGFSVCSQTENSSVERKLEEARSVSHSNPSEALKKGKEALALAKKSGKKKEVQKSYLVIGEIYRVLGEFRKAEKSVRNAYSAETDSILLPDVLRELGVILKQQTRFNEALPLYIKAVGHYKNRNQKREVAKMYNNIGRLHYAMDDLEIALHYYELALEINRSLEPSISIGINNHNIGAIYEAKGKLSAAHIEYMKALKVYREFDDKVLIAYCYNSLGNVESNIDQARAYLENGMKMRKDLGLEKDFIESRLNMAKLELRAGNEQRAIDHLRWVYFESSKFELLHFALTATKYLSEIYERRNNLTSAIEFTRISFVLQDSLHVREERVKELGFEYRYKEVSLNDSIADLTRENDLKELEIEVRDNEIKVRQQAQLFWIVFSAMVIIVVAITTYLLIRQRKINHELIVQKSVIEEKSAENEILVREVHHRVKNNLHSVLGILRIERRRLIEPEAIDALEATEQKVGTIATIHELLYGQDNLSQVGLKEYIEAVANRVLEFSQEKKIAIEVTGSSPKVEAEVALPVGQIMAELIANSVKHAFSRERNPKINVEISIEENWFRLLYADNGCGMNSTIRDDAFGMKMIQSLVRKRNGELFFIEADGYSVEMRFPLSI